MSVIEKIINLFRTRRSWNPNVLQKRLYSETLDDFVHSFEN